MLLRVIISPQDIRKLRLDTAPNSVDGLKLVLKDKLQLSQPFDLQYEDEDFQDFCNLTCVDDLPKEKATLKVNFCVAVSSDSSLDSFVAPSPSASSSLSSHSESFAGRLQPWPTTFSIPTFSYDVELRLRQGNDAFRKDGTLLSISRDMKSEILEKIAEAIYSFKAYPRNEEFECVAIALVEKHPCLKEPGSTSGWYGWKLSLKFKMGNYRQKLRDAGCRELMVNSEKRGSEDMRGKRNKVKKPRRSETNFLPDLPQGRDLRHLEEEREKMAQEMRKATPNLVFIDQAMNATYALRRQEIVEEEPPISEMMVRWPALFTERQIIKEFTRLMSMDLTLFYERLDSHLLRLLQLFRSKRFEGNKEMTSLLESLDKDVSNQKKRATALHGLPWYMKENPSAFMKMCEPTDPEEDVIRGMLIGILLVAEDVKEPLPASYNDIAIVVEEIIVIRHLRDVPSAFVNLMGLLYILNIDYPKDLKYTFEVIQRLFMGIGLDACTARVHSLKNKLFI
ncbi:sterile alpha motif domain-containing protein 3-like [Brienomyrus brachyistius]|uniref:sterile alpha motif domain-containing protein 3-like n=1 Tax=Brienomyrus brachyistius TaxID=42636 RepID=UPI0020B3D666|nr:sterile alpha motif domain-containing protein 3-like [Brienomyrus brachyistius]XP_048880259.1 sterile alpha motif domain-containing protein 3-like [Brienomyrus brachyistius]XP_048880260.1 sterile alpha motif domain-containing protein 3-like [Brienomyrus brachyistius]XP_048880261.1 sterile alpha motif domain-containing protein 3-like [Brienomyrus brachyistius]XP_048886292.1 sterile alpha motif domain-containing protein 3-like [Brienomyrus brachyistius]XP_048886302.1 sterile alpha motif domai